MPAFAATLPRSRSLQRRRGMTAWWIALGSAVVANLVIVLLLAQASRMQAPIPPPPIAVISLNRVPPPPPPPPPLATPAVATPAPAAAAPIPLPDLDLPITTTSEAWTLPPPVGLDHGVALPLLVPAFTVPRNADLVAARPLDGLDIDTPAERLGAFDLDRFYPRSARLRGITGRTRLRLTLDAHGEVTAWQVVDSTPPGVFDEAAARIVRSLRYRPAKAGGTDVPTVVDEVIAWTIR